MSDCAAVYDTVECIATLDTIATLTQFAIFATVFWIAALLLLQLGSFSNNDDEDE